MSICFFSSTFSLVPILKYNGRHKDGNTEGFARKQAMGSASAMDEHKDTAPGGDAFNPDRAWMKINDGVKGALFTKGQLAGGS